MNMLRNTYTLVSCALKMNKTTNATKDLNGQVPYWESCLFLIFFLLQNWNRLCLCTRPNTNKTNLTQTHLSGLLLKIEAIWAETKCPEAPCPKYYTRTQKWRWFHQGGFFTFRGPPLEKQIYDPSSEKLTLPRGGNNKEFFFPCCCFIWHQAFFDLLSYKLHTRWWPSFRTHQCS